MELFERMERFGHEHVAFSQDPSCGYKGIIAIHDTTLGPALGGTRFWNYTSEAEALDDVFRLARGMTYKAAIAGLNLGGGKSVIIGDPRRTDREAIFRAHGRFVESLAGRYITAEDVGTSGADMDYVHMETEHVVGLLDRSGDPSPVTAFGVFRGIQAAAHQLFGTEELSGLRVAVQGLGNVGRHLIRHLAEAGASLIITDIDAERISAAVREYGARAVAPDEIHSVEADIFSPCALGATVNDRTIEALKVRIIAGSANNVLADSSHGERLHERGILYAPDYVINAGGLINVYGEISGWSGEQAMRKAGEIYSTLLQLFELSRADDIPTSRAADRVAEQRIEQVSKLRPL